MLIPSPKELALLVVTQRKKMKLSQSDVGRLAGLKQQTISEFESRPEGSKLNTVFSILSAISLDMKITPKDQKSTPENVWKEEW